ncbi:MAG TPA: helix-turn-helix transcriptional regulator, partial [Verrucomicrobiae bacterium]
MNAVKAERSAPKKAPGVEPAEAISRHLGSRVKHLRTDRGWSLEALANASGVSRSMLSQIEREQANPTLAVTLRIAQAFGLSLGDLLEMPSAISAVTVIRADDRAYHYRSDKKCRIRTLSPLNLEKDVEFYEVQLQPGGALRSAAHF